MNDLKTKIKEGLINFNKNFYSFRVKKLEKKKIKDKRRVELYSKVSYSKTEEEEIQKYYIENYGRKIDLRWHRLYQSFTGNFDKRYFPEILFSSDLELKLCNRVIASQLTDKCMVELLYGSVENLYIPKTTVLCASGIFYNQNREIISNNEAISLISNCGKKIIKKIKDSDSGRGVLIVDIKDGIDKKNNKSVEELLKEFKDDFIIQEMITNREDIRNIYDKSLNTFRIITYTCNGKLYHAPIVMRIGQAGCEVDNIHAGGMFIGVNDDGGLLDTAYTEFQQVYKIHPDSRIKFKDCSIDGIDRVIDIAYKCHGLTPHMGMISWDFCIDEKDRVVLIEVNIKGQSIWFPQMAHGKSFFGDNTEYMLNMIKK